MIITPYSGRALALTQANCPALKHVFTVDGIVGSTIEDAVGDVVLTSTTGWTAAAGGFRAATSATFSETGTWAPVSAGQTVIALVTGIIAATTTNPFYFGDTSVGAGLDTVVGAGGFVAKDDLNYLTLATLAPSPNTDIEAVAVQSLINGASSTGTKYCVNSTNTTITSGASTLTLDMTGFALADGKFINTGTSRIKQALLFVFDTAPADTGAAMAWMQANPGYLYPAWAGRS